MGDKDKAAFLVDAYSDPAIVKINGRANFANSGPLREFFDQAIGGGKQQFIIDFKDCEGMDSTVLGILAGAALELRKHKPAGNLFLCRLGKRNLELIRNLGLHYIMEVDSNRTMSDPDAGQLSEASEQGTVDRRRMVLDAHESLIKADEGNRSKFQDVVSYLKNQVE